MNNLQVQLTAVQSKLNAERELGGQKDADKIEALEAQEADLTRQIMEQAQQERVQAQAEAVELIELPFDFNDVFSEGDFKVTIANDMIIEVIKGFQRTSDEKHNAEIDSLAAEWSDKLRAAADREAQWQRQNAELQKSLEAERQQAKRDAQEFIDLEQHVAQFELEKQDAESKRDAAVSKAEGLELLLSEKQAEIDVLRQEKAEASAPKRAIDILPTDKLAQMVKETNDVKAARGLARWNQTNPELAVTPLEIPVFPSATPLDQIDMGQDTNVEVITQEDFRNGDNLATGNEMVHSGESLGAEHPEEIQAPTGETERRQNSVSREELDAIVARVEALEAKVA